MPKFIHEKRGNRYVEENDSRIKKRKKHPLQKRGRRTNDTIVSAVIKNYTEISQNTQQPPY